MAFAFVDARPVVKVLASSRTGQVPGLGWNRYRPRAKSDSRDARRRTETTTQMISRLHDARLAGPGINALVSGMLVKTGDTCAFDNPSSEHSGDEPIYKFPLSANDARRHSERLASYIAVYFGWRQAAGS
jgi:hypothetical protein